jgi:opacity protein-like surface antigen
MNAREVLLVTRVLDTHYDNPVPGTPTNNSASWQALLGVDYDGNTVWRFRMLGGVEYRQSESTAIASQTTGIAEAEITWQPSGMTTMRATAVRGIEDAAQTGLSNYTYDSARLSLDHEYLRNVLLNASATVREATFNQTGGQQFGFAFGAGATWLVNRNARLSLTYDFTDVRNAHLAAGTVAGDYTRGLTLLTLRLGL